MANKHGLSKEQRKVRKNLRKQFEKLFGYMTLEMLYDMVPVITDLLIVGNEFSENNILPKHMVRANYLLNEMQRERIERRQAMVDALKKADSIQFVESAADTLQEEVERRRDDENMKPSKKQLKALRKAEREQQTA